MKTFRQKFYSNTAWIIGGKICQSVVSLVVGALVARHLGPTNSGIIDYITSFITIFSSFATLGVNNILVKELVDNKDDEGKILASSMFLTFISSSLCCITIIGIVIIFNYTNTLMIVCAIILSLQLIFQVLGKLTYWYQSKLNSKTTTIITCIAYVIVAVFKIIIVIFKLNVIWYALSISLDYLLIAIFTLYKYKKDNGQKLIFDKAIAKKLLKNSYHFILAGIMVSLYTQMDKIMLKALFDVTEVGYYGKAVTICNMWVFILTAIIESASPIIYSIKENKEQYKLRMKQVFCVVIWISIIVSIFITIFAKYIVLIIYGSEFLPAASSLRILSWATIFSFIGSANEIWMLVDNSQKLVKWFALIGCVVNFVLNLLFIKMFGAIGAAFATVITQVVASYFALLFFKESREKFLWVTEAFVFKGVNLKNSFKEFYFKKIKKKNDLIVPPSNFEDNDKNFENK